jgi:N-acetylglucosamine kinase-like BadF-type ATPase
MNHKHTKYNPTDLFCGIDGGGTTTKVVVCNRDGEIVYSFLTGTINHYGAGIVKVRENFQVIASHLLDYFGCLPGNIFAGNSALSNKVGDEIIQDLTAGAFAVSKINFHSDVYIALLGYTLGNPGAVLISGTGSMACGIDTSGVYHTAGGWGQVLGDEGSGYHMAQEGMKAALSAYDGMSKPTQLTQRLIRYFNLKDVSDIIKKIYYPPVEKSVIAAFATEVEQAAVAGDEVAVKILEQEAEWLYKLALTICNACDTKKLGYFGSVLNRNETILLLLKTHLNTYDITLHTPLFSPEIGALIAAFREADIILSKTITDNFLKYKTEN